MRYLLLASLILLAGCYTPERYRVTLHEHEVKALLEGKPVTLSSEDATESRPRNAPWDGPPIEVHYAQPFRIVFMVPPEDTSEAQENTDRDADK